MAKKELPLTARVVPRRKGLRNTRNTNCKYLDKDRVDTMKIQLVALALMHCLTSCTHIEKSPSITSPIDLHVNDSKQTTHERPSYHNNSLTEAVKLAVCHSYMKNKGLGEQSNKMLEAALLADENVLDSPYTIAKVAELTNMLSGLSYSDIMGMCLDLAQRVEDSLTGLAAR